MTVADVTGAGGAVEADESARTWTVEPRAMQLPSKVTVEPDLSNAAPFLGAALIAGGTVRVPHWPETTTQPGGLLPGYLEQMGAKVSFPTIDGVRYCEVTGDGTVRGLGTFDLTAAGRLRPRWRRFWCLLISRQTWLVLVTCAATKRIVWRHWSTRFVVLGERLRNCLMDCVSNRCRRRRCTVL